jgi:CRP/FNR family transcriptional regulator, cyclic AMP receptor protein
MSAARLLTQDAELLAGVSEPGRRRAARETVVVEELRLGLGDQLDAASIARQASLGALVVSGFLAREITIAGRVSADLAGPDDLLCPTYLEPPDDLFAYTVSWVALGPTRLALLDDAFSVRVRPWPEILCVLVERARRLGDRAALGRAIARSATVEVRLLMSLWHWASSWSSVTAGGVRLAVPLSHERLARLIGASRPTVTTAVGRLRRAGYLNQSRDGRWLLLEAHSGTLELGEEGAAPGVARMREPPSLDGRARVRSPWDLRSANRPDLYARLAEQRELLRLTADHHAAQLTRLRERSSKLRAAAELSELARQARAWPDESTGEETAPAGDGTRRAVGDPHEQAV